MKSPNLGPSLRLCALSCILAFFFLLPSGQIRPTPLALSATLLAVEDSTLTLALVGDVMLGRGVAQELDGDWEAAFTEVQPWLAEADLAFANLESPLTTAPLSSTKGAYDLRAPPEAVTALRVAGFDIVSLANNHALDADETGLAQTVATLDTAGITGLVDGSASTMYHFLAFDDSIAPLDVKAASDAVAAAAERANVVVSIHWGGEYQAAPGPRQRAVARALADAGAKIIVGHGPHVLQRVEWIEETLVAYSLGNFLFDQPYPVDCRWGAILRVTLQSSRVVAVTAVPTVVEQGRVRVAAPDEAAAIYARMGLKPVQLRLRKSSVEHLMTKLARNCVKNC